MPYESDDGAGPCAVRFDPGVDAVAAYRVPRHPAPVELRLDGNEGAHAPESIVAGILADGLVREYPDASRLEASVARRFGVDPERVIATAGGDDALCRLLRLVAVPGGEIVLPVPTFEMIRTYARLHGLGVREVEWSGPRWPREAAIAAIGANTTAVVIVSPNNPTGAVATIEDVERTAAAAEGTLVILDQAYAEYDDDGPTRAALTLPNVVTVRSMSKAWGLAGLRVGYAVGPAPLVGRLRAVGQPYALSGPSVAVADRALASDDSWMRSHVRRVQQERDTLADALRSLGAEPRPSRANFVLADFDDADWTADALAGLGIAVRRFPGRSGLDRALRITCPGNPSEFDRLLRGLRAARSPEAVLLDMDGVLADASGSYREAIVRTAAEFGVEITADTMTRAKSEGDANNDWIVTHRLLRRAGVDVELEVVTERFERWYHGDGRRPGLKSSERLIPSANVLDRLAGRLPLAVVTGRPRRDACEFLERFGVADRFDAVITMEDGPAKPDPAPVLAALGRLGVSNAWLVGDTPDDVRAARGAGVVPLGVVAPGDERSMADVLLRSGAARIVAGLDQIEGLLATRLDDGGTR